jgi:glucose/arabinose dehydrogenase
MTRTLLSLSAATLALGTFACAQDRAVSDSDHPFTATEIAKFDEPWAMTFLPDGRFLVTEKRGELHWATEDGDISEPISGVPEVDYGGQGGLGDVILHPDYAENGMIYLSYAEAGDGDIRGAAVARGMLELTETGGRLSDVEVIWRQDPKVPGRGHYGHRLAFSPDGEYLFISSGERQKFDPAQDMNQNLGKIIRVMPDGSIPDDNPFAGQGGVTAQIWSLGHRNPLGIAFDAEGTLWEHEMGPKGGDEFQKIERGENYGYPEVSDGDHYDGREIPDHETMPRFRAAEEVWTPVISPAGLIIYQGEMFPDWQGSAFIGGLSSQALVRVTFDCQLDGREICEAERFNMNARIREVEEGPDGAIWLLQDERRGSGGMLLKLTPRD